jgi:hypothetical protein
MATRREKEPQMMDWSNYEEENQPPKKAWWAIPVEVLIATLIAIALAGAMRRAYAEPLFSASAEGAVITLTNEPCALKAIGNLPFKATWVEKDKTFEGCWGARPDAGYVLAYFDDRTVALIPIQAFKKVVGV